jgi:hypothetical protein
MFASSIRPDFRSGKPGAPGRGIALIGGIAAAGAMAETGGILAPDFLGATADRSGRST